MPDQTVRIDRWLHAVRLYKTRSLAAEACQGGKVKVQGQAVKSARQVKVGEIYHIRKGSIEYIIQVLKIINKRLAPPEAAVCYEDLTPPEAKQSLLDSAFVTLAKRDRGTGRPTKKERREIDRFMDDSDED